MRVRPKLYKTFAEWKSTQFSLSLSVRENFVSLSGRQITIVFVWKNLAQHTLIVSDAQGNQGANERCVTQAPLPAPRARPLVALGVPGVRGGLGHGGLVVVQHVVAVHEAAAALALAAGVVRLLPGDLLPATHSRARALQPLILTTKCVSKKSSRYNVKCSWEISGCFSNTLRSRKM